MLRPSQTLQRFMRIGKPVPGFAIVQLPWGAKIGVHPNENVGSEIYHYGIFDKIVPEAIWRLLDHGDTAFEIGANIGQNCSLMAAKVGRDGHVLAFEPHPEIFAELKANCALAKQLNWASIQLENVALGENPETLAKLRRLGYTKFVWISESPLLYALRVTNTCEAERKRWGFPVHPPISTSNWHPVYESDEVVIKELPAQ